MVKIPIHHWESKMKNTMCRFSPFSFLCISLLLGGCKTSMWDGVDRALPKTTAINVIAISCHNCYTKSLSMTLTKIHQAQAAGADLIELDISKIGGNNTIYVNHDDPDSLEDPSELPRLVDVLADAQLRSGNQLLFIEIKEKNPSQSFANEVVQIVRDSGFMTSGRPVVYRAFSETNLTHIANAMNLPQNEPQRDYVKRSYLFHRQEHANEAQWHYHINALKDDGLAMVEFHRNTKNLFGKIGYARSLNLGVNLYTYSDYVEVWGAVFRNEIDAITIEGGPQSIALVRDVVLDDNRVIYTNLARQKPGDSNKIFYEDNAGVKVLNLGDPHMPGFETLDVGEDRFGGSFVFSAANQDYIRFYDGDNNPQEGYLVSTVLNFDDLNLNVNETQAILQKADAGGFALELNRSSSNGSGVLRFGVHVNGAYRYVTKPLSDFNGTDSYHITCAYDGGGGVRMWINDVEVPGAPVENGGVTLNNSPIMLGADPQGASNQRFYFSGKIQMAIVQKWGPH